LARALALDTDTQASQHGRALWAAGGLAFFVGEYAETGRIGAQLDAYGRGVDSDLDVRNGLTLRGLTALAEGEYTVAVDIFGEALEICPETAEWERATSLFNLAIALLHKGNVERADDLLAQAHDRYAAVGDEIYRARAIRNRAFAALARRDMDAASEFVELSLAVTTRVGDSWGIAESLEAVAVHRAARGDAYGCAAALARAGRLRDRIGASPYPFDSAFAERFIASVRNAGGWDEGWADDQPVTDG
jgi:tetratricopeptide (TPR) repeat protein